MRRINLVVYVAMGSILERHLTFLLPWWPGGDYKVSWFSFFLSLFLFALYTTVYEALDADNK